MEYEGLLELVKKRRSVRKIKPDPIPDGSVEKIIEIARWAPSGFNTQPWEFVVVRKRELKEKISEILQSNMPVPPSGQKDGDNADNSKNAKPGGLDPDIPVFIILCGDWRAKVGLPGDMPENPERYQKVYQSGMASAFLYMHMAAASMGLASRWVSTASSPVPEKKIKGLLGIPEPLFIYDMMALGYGASTPPEKLLKPLEDMIHYDDCGEDDFKTDEEVIAFAEKTKGSRITAQKKGF